jgi:hypothetical protein
MRLGDYLYDIAYLYYWPEDHFYMEQWHAYSASQGRQEPNFEARIRCYQLHTVCNDLAVSAIQGDLESYRKTKERLRVILDQADLILSLNPRGPTRRWYERPRCSGF